MGLIFIIVVIAIVWVLFAQNYGAGRGTFTPGARDVPTNTETPLDILNRRYARGEIDRAEYLERRRDLA